MSDDTLTMERLLADMDRLGLGAGSRRFGGLCFPPRVVVSDYLPVEQPRKLTRWERFRVWVENLADRAEVYYHYPRVKRTEPTPAYLIGDRLYVTPRTAAAIRLSN